MIQTNPNHSTCNWLSQSTRRSLLREYGDFTLAYATEMQSGLEHFGDDRGYIAFARRSGFVFALGDPVTSDRHRSSLLHDFIGEHPKACYCQVSEATATVLNNAGLYVSQFGFDVAIDLPKFDFKGKAKERFRYAENWLKRREFRIEELRMEEAADAVVEISRRWRKTRPTQNREVRFLNRPLVMDDEVDVRRFFLLDPHGEKIAFIFFDPLYRSQELIGYATAFKRRDPEAPNTAEAGIIKAAIDRFKEEDASLVRLGLAPLACETESTFRGNPILDPFFRFSYSSSWVNRSYYNLAGHAAYKRRFHGNEETLYFATPNLFNTRRMLALLRLCNLI